MRVAEPALILLPESTAEVVAALRFARDRDRPVTARSGGHGLSGHAANDGGVVVGLSALNRVEVIDRRRRLVRVQDLLPDVRHGRAGPRRRPSQQNHPIVHKVKIMTTQQIHQHRDARSPRDWAARAACQDTDPSLFFPITWDGHPGHPEERARRICHACPVQAACLDWALSTGEPDGVWGGTTPEERRRIRSRQRLATA
ncbi:WhiB family transcriptional regulator [Nonomuraea sp. NPDC049480]|uniref:WhiB family transcriptional regulator n=1 Tax=Nonomuraea sp. NPDC049480 TaxID=3364353 RepID=UPI0037A21A61